jgi:hypothetical protein
MSSQQSYLVTLNGDQKIINPDGTWNRVCAVVPEQAVEPEAVERDVEVELIPTPTDIPLMRINPIIRKQLGISLDDIIGMPYLGDPSVPSRQALEAENDAFNWSEGVK